jgi:hypothetical protein
MLIQPQKSVKRTAVAAILLLIPLAPAISNPGRLWQSAHCTVGEVTSRAQTFYQTVRFVYCAQYQSEHPHPAK